MPDILRTPPWQPDAPDRDTLLQREWLVTNGIGGYASGTVGGVNTRHFHGLLIAALPGTGRVMMFNHLYERLHLADGSTIDLGGEEPVAQEPVVHSVHHLEEFRLENGLPVWRFRVEGRWLEKRVLLPHRQNTVHISYRLLEGEPLWLELRPALHFRPHEVRVSQPLQRPYTLTARNDRFEIGAPDDNLPPLRLKLHGAEGRLTLDGGWQREFFHRIEAERGYGEVGELWSPGYFSLKLEPGATATLVGSTESWNTLLALSPAAAAAAEAERRHYLLAAAQPAARTGFGGELTLAADQFLIVPVGRASGAIRAHASGMDDMRTVIAGYHWFTDWGRDTMISLEGLTLITGRHTEAGDLLRTFGHYLRDGLIPNLFPEGEEEGLYHTADATLWFFHALHRYLAVTGDRTLLRNLLPKLIDSADSHLRGTRYGIHVDPADGLLVQGAGGYQLTWMDAKVDDWVVTPRRGKAVEINALWYNALCLLAHWLDEEGDTAAAQRYVGHAEQARESFNRRFWYEAGGYLYDVVDSEQGDDDAACRPNQVFAIALDHPVLARERWAAVMQVVEERLLTPVGLRSLSPEHSDYKSNYYGDLRARDAAYHQGTVWGWLIGPFIDAWLTLHPDDKAGARRLLAGFDAHLNDACIGSISEIFDAAPPFAPRGCVAQAWSIAEVLRCWVKTA